MDNLNGDSLLETFYLFESNPLYYMWLCFGFKQGCIVVLHGSWQINLSLAYWRAVVWAWHNVNLQSTKTRFTPLIMHTHTDMIWILVEWGPLFRCSMKNERDKTFRLSLATQDFKIYIFFFNLLKSRTLLDVPGNLSDVLKMFDTSRHLVLTFLLHLVALHVLFICHFYHLIFLPSI
jgi:hypothetical protein